MYIAFTGFAPMLVAVIPERRSFEDGELFWYANDWRQEEIIIVMMIPLLIKRLENIGT